MAQRLARYMPSAAEAANGNSIPEDIKKKAKSYRKGDDDPALLKLFPALFEKINPKGMAPVPEQPNAVIEFLTHDLLYTEVMQILYIFRVAGLDDSEKSLVLDKLKYLHRTHCDVFETYFNYRPTRDVAYCRDDDDSNLSKLSDVLACFHHILVTSNMMHKGSPPPAHPSDFSIASLTMIIAVTPVKQLVMMLQKEKNRRQHVDLAEENAANPDGTTLSEFVWWVYCFYNFILHVYKTMQGKRPNERAAILESLAKQIAGCSLALPITPDVQFDQLYKEFTQKYAGHKPKKDVLAHLHVHQLSFNLNVPSNYGKFTRDVASPWVIDLIYPDMPASQTVIRMGIEPFYPVRPTVFEQLSVFMQHILSSTIPLELPSSIAFSLPEDALLARPFLMSKVLYSDIGATTSEIIPLTAQQDLTQPKEFPPGYVKAATKDAAGVVVNPVLYWRWQAEHLLAKSTKVSPEYLQNFYAKARQFYLLKPWLHFSSRVFIELAVNGFGHAVVCVTGDDGGPVAVRLHKTGVPVDVKSLRSEVIFTTPARIPVVDVEAIEMLRIPVLDCVSHPCVFRDHQTFKRPPHVELEMFRACFEILPSLINEQGSVTNISRLIADPTSWVLKRLPFSIPGEAHPVQATISYPSQLQRDVIGEGLLPAPQGTSFVLPEGFAVLSNHPDVLHSLKQDWQQLRDLSCSLEQQLPDTPNIIAKNPAFNDLLLSCVAARVVSRHPSVVLPELKSNVAFQLALTLNKTLQSFTAHGASAAALALFYPESPIYAPDGLRTISLLAGEVDTPFLKTLCTMETLQASDIFGYAYTSVSFVDWRSSAGSLAWLTEVMRSSLPFPRCVRKCGHKTCLNALPNSSLKRCAGCKTDSYCSKECSVAAWPAHKVECKKIQALPVGSKSVP